MPLFGAWPVTGHQNTNHSDTAKTTVGGTTVVTPKARVGSVYPDVNGGKWMYIIATQAVWEGHLVQIQSFSSTGLSAKAVTGNTTLGRMPVGIVGGIIAQDDYGWAQVFGSNTHCGLIADTETVTALVGRTLFISGTAGLVTSDTTVPDLIYGMYTTVTSSTAVTASSQTGDTNMVKIIDVDLVYPYAYAGATTIQ